MDWGEVTVDEIVTSLREVKYCAGQLKHGKLSLRHLPRPTVGTHDHMQLYMHQPAAMPAVTLQKAAVSVSTTIGQV